MILIETKLVRLARAYAITVFPFIFIDPDTKNKELVLTHELIHYFQQKRWAIYGLGMGLLIWFILYLLVLPVGWNPFRRKWETEAFKAEHFSLDFINQILKKPPYYLWW